MIDKFFRVLRAVCVPLLAVSLLASDRSAHAQGTMGQLAGPMSSDELHMHLDRFLEFDLDQALAIGPLHQAYLAEFRVLREGRIAAFLESSRDLENGGAMPDIRKVRKYADQQASIQTSIRKLDDRLFGQIVQLFPEESASSLERARNSRARTRARSGLTAQMGLMGTRDLWLVVDRLQLTPDQRESFARALLPWEERSTVLSKQAAKAGSSMMIKMVEKFDELGFSGEEFSDLDYSDPEHAQKLQQLMMTVQQVFMEVQQESGEAIAQLRRLNSRTVRDVEAVLDPWLARNFKNAYVKQAGMLGFGGYESQFEDEFTDFAIDAPGSTFILKGDQLFNRDPIAFIEFLQTSELLPPQVQGQIAVLLQAYLHEDLDLLDDGIKLSEDLDPTMMGLEASAMMSDGTSQDEFESAQTPMMKLAREIRESSSRRQRIRKNLIRDIAQAIDFQENRRLESELYDGMRSIRPNPEASDRERPMMGFSTNAMEFTAARSYKEPRKWIADPIDPEVIERLLGQLGDAEWLGPVFDSMYVDYRADWEERVTPAIQAHSRANDSFYANAGQGDASRLAPSVVLDRLRAAIEAVRAHDRALFDSLAATSTDDLRSTVELERRVRMLEIALGGAGQQATMMAFAPDTSGGDANILEVLATFDITPEQRSGIAVAIGEELDSVVESRRVLQGDLIELSRMQLQQHYDFMQSQAEPDSEDSEPVMLIQNALSRGPEGMKDRVDLVSDSEEAFVGRVVELLPEDSRDEFSSAIRIARHPAIYGYDDEIQAAFELTDRMTDLQGDQRAAIEVIKAEFDRDWVDSGDRMIDCVDRMQMPEDMNDRSGWQDYLDAQMEHALLDFDRRESAVQGLRRIAALLDDEQRVRIPAIKRLASEYSVRQRAGRLADVPVNQP